MSAEPTGHLSLVDDIWKVIGCGYISDLTMPHMCQAVFNALREIDAESYLLSDWRDAVRYISGDSKTCVKTIEEAVAKLYDYCGAKKEK